MGCVNGKPASHYPDTTSYGSERPSRAQKTVEKTQRKSMRSFLRAILFAKKSKSSSKIAPEISSTQVESPSLVCSNLLPL